MSKKTSNRYTLEFKKESAKLASSSDKSISMIADEIGVSKTALSIWVKQYSPLSIVDSSQSLEQENKQLKKELSRVKQERDILKKATAYFSAAIL